MSGSKNCNIARPYFHKIERRPCVLAPGWPGLLRSSIRIRRWKDDEISLLDDVENSLGYLAWCSVGSASVGRHPAWLEWPLKRIAFTGRRFGGVGREAADCYSCVTETDHRADGSRRDRGGFTRRCLTRERRQECCGFGEFRAVVHGFLLDTQARDMDDASGRNRLRRSDD